MKAPNLHFNLLKPQERVSPSPVRLRILMPVLAFAACAAMLAWWAILATRQYMVTAQIRGVETELKAKRTQHAETLKDMGEANEIKAELAQLGMYAKGRRTYGEFLARLAEATPATVQLLALEMPPPGPQDLRPPGLKPGAKAVPLAGPTGTTERVALRILGRTVREQPVIDLMKAFEGERFTNVLTTVRDPLSPGFSPKIHSFRQDVAESGSGARLLAFDVEYVCRERDFSE